jgi:hypothetical protein
VAQLRILLLYYHLKTALLPNSTTALAAALALLVTRYEPTASQHTDK